MNNIFIKYFKNSAVKIIVNPDRVEVHLPMGYDELKAKEIVSKYEPWIERKLRELSELVEISKQLEVVNRSVEELKQLAKNYADQASREVLGISNPCKIVVRDMTRKWASLSKRGVLTINKLACYLPDSLVKYIVYHEICHFIEKKHNKRYWSCVEKTIPNYKELESKLRAYEVKLKTKEALTNLRVLKS
ncbi:MAG: M48 family metallopeptidase [Desulfurococcaceae archaeon]